MNRLGAIMSACVALLPGRLLGAEYPNGHTWRFRSDYAPGALHGASMGYGNPQSDSLGATPWTYEWLPEGGTLGGPASSQWFRGAGTLMTWDSSYFGFPRWSKSDEVGGNIESGYLEHLLRAGADRSVPLLRWTNPVSRTVTVQVSDVLRLHWWSGTTATIEAALTSFSSASLTHTVLFAVSLGRPGSLPADEGMDVPIAPFTITLQPGDSVTLSVRANGTGACCVRMDSDLTLTLIEGGTCPGDADGSRTVTFQDVTAVLANFNAVCP